MCLSFSFFAPLDRERSQSAYEYLPLELDMWPLRQRTNMLRFCDTLGNSLNLTAHTIFSVLVIYVLQPRGRGVLFCWCVFALSAIVCIADHNAPIDHTAKTRTIIDPFARSLTLGRFKSSSLLRFRLVFPETNKLANCTLSQLGHFLFSSVLPC